ncbi:MAG: ABC transporter ATP-binding protein [Methanomicrobiaceae archaeon]|nr:ABC transporter ATP-binding protein [Methanomicrobiaceae archaeon]
MLDVAGLDVYHGNLHVIWDLSLHISGGEIVTILGSNGAGKTTVVETLFGLNTPASGKIAFRGEDITGLPPFTIVPRGMSLVPEKRELFPKMTVRENLELGAFATSKETADYDRIFSLFPVLHEREGQLAGTLSGGEQQMLAIARSLMAAPGMLVLDEPSLGLSPKLVGTVLDTIRDLNRDGLTILLVEQNVRNALEISHRGYVLENGRIVGSGTSDELLEDEHVKAAYLGA